MIVIYIVFIDEVHKFSLFIYLFMDYTNGDDTPTKGVILTIIYNHNMGRRKNINRYKFLINMQLALAAKNT